MSMNDRLVRVRDRPLLLICGARVRMASIMLPLRENASPRHRRVVNYHISKKQRLICHLILEV